MEWALLPLKRYADFSGRSRRKEYWLFALLVFAVTFALALLIGVFDHRSMMADGNPFMAGSAFALIGLFVLAIIIPSIAVQVRRFHDQDKSGWFVLLNLIPYIGGLIVLVFMCLEGTRGPNRFGEDPKAGEPGHQQASI